MDGRDERLEIALEGFEPVMPWWKRVLAVLGSQYGRSQVRFVARSDGQTVYTGAPFFAPLLATALPDEASAPGMEESLSELRRRIAQDGWVQAGRGSAPWSYSYVRAPGGRGLGGHR